MNCKKVNIDASKINKDTLKVKKKNVRKITVSQNHGFIESDDEKVIGNIAENNNNGQHLINKGLKNDNSEQHKEKKNAKTKNLTSEFIQTQYNNPNHIIDIHKQAQKTDVNLRRIKEIAKILEAAEFIKKVKKNEYMLNNELDHELDDIKELVQEIEKEEEKSQMLDNMICDTIYDIEQVGTNSDKDGALYLASNDIENLAQVMGKQTVFLVQVDNGTTIKYTNYMGDEVPDNPETNQKNKDVLNEDLSEKVKQLDIKHTPSLEKQSTTKSDQYPDTCFYQAVIKTVNDQIKIYQIDN